MRQQYQEALSVEVEVFQERIQTRKHQGLRGSELVKAVVQDWEDTVKRVASKEIGEKVIVCGKAARWWDEEIKDKIRLRRQVYKEIQSGREDKWGQYYNLRSEIKELVRKKLSSSSKKGVGVYSSVLIIHSKVGLLQESGETSSAA